MKRDSLLAALCLALSAAAGCYANGDGLNQFGVGSGGVGPTTTTDPTVTVTGDLPCDLVQALATCTTCHGSPLAGGAPNRLLTHGDLTAPSHSDPTQTVAQLSIARMKSSNSPMPPSGIPAPAVTAVLEQWVADGMPTGACGGVDGGAGDGGGSVYDTPSVCTSGTTYTRGHNTLMRPGGACVACHSSDEGPRYSIAGTVYPTAHEPNDCNGVSDPSVQVVITDASGKTFTLPVNGAGNFESGQGITPPYTAKVVAGTKVRTMSSPQSNGDCNACHTEQGTSGAPGRIIAP